MRHRIITSFITASALALSLHAAAPATQAATGPSTAATCTTIAGTPYRSGSTVYSTHTIRCTSVVSKIYVYGILHRSWYNNYTFLSKGCVNTTECSLTLSAPFTRDTWTSSTSGTVDGVEQPTATSSAYLY
jgi:hypothetical protein